MLWVSFESFYEFSWPVCLRELWFDFNVTCYRFCEIESTIVEDLFDFLEDFSWFLRVSDWLKELVYAEVSLNRFDETLVVNCALFHYLLQSVIFTTPEKCLVYS